MDNKSKKGFSLYTFVNGIVIALTVVFAVIVILIGSYAFTQSFTNEYNDSVYRIARFSAEVVDGDSIDDYLASTEEEVGSKFESYATTKQRLTSFCNNMGMSVIYVIKPSDDYQSYTSIFNCLNDNSPFTEWELGHVEDINSNDYAEAYKNIIEKGSDREIVLREFNLNGANPHITALVPIKDSNGNVTAIMCVQRELQDLVDARRSFIQGVSGLAIVLLIISLLIVGRVLRKRLINPVKVIATETDRFAEENTLPEESLLSEIASPVKEVRALAVSIDKMESDTVKNIEDITRFTSEKERLDVELELAANIQKGMLPKREEFLADKDCFDVYASMNPAREVGGDFYDYYMLDDNHLVILIADVSDKGAGAAFFMAISMTLIRARAKMGGNAAEIIKYVDDVIAEKNSEGMFVTVWMAIIDLSTGHVNVCNAGHDYPAIMKGGEDYFVDKTSRHGPPIGFIPGARFKDYEFDINPGDRIFLYTDGLNEAKSASGERFGLDNILETLNAHKDATNEELVEAMIKRADAFEEGVPQFDDRTMLSFTYIKKL